MSSTHYDSLTYRICHCKYHGLNKGILLQWVSSTHYDNSKYVHFHRKYHGLSEGILLQWLSSTHYNGRPPETPATPGLKTKQLSRESVNVRHTLEAILWPEDVVDPKQARSMARDMPEPCQTQSQADSRESVNVRHTLEATLWPTAETLRSRVASCAHLTARTPSQKHPRVIQGVHLPGTS